jgi:DNA polymerase III delta prime subunit
MEEVQETTRFILVANDISGIHEALLSRCQVINFNSPDATGIAKYVMTILKREGVKVSDDAKKDLVKLIKALFPDIRRIIGNVQASVLNGALTSITNTSDALLTEIVTATIEGDFDTVREKLRTNNVRYPELYAMLFDRVDEFKHVGDAVIEIGEAIWRDKTVANKEINFLTMCVKIMKAGQ